MAEEVKIVKDGLNMAMGLYFPKKDWHVISFDWYLSWKRYTDSSTQHDANSLHPGQIVNLPLLNPVNNIELNPGLIENKDYILLPKSSAEVLYKRYTVDAVIPRFVVNNGTPHSPLYQVEMYPALFRIHECSKDQPDIKSDALPVYRLGSKHEFLELLVSAYKSSQKKVQSYAQSTRIWIKLTEPSRWETIKYTLRSGDELTTRLVQTENTDSDGTWTYLRNSRVKIGDLIGDSNSIEVIFEQDAPLNSTEPVGPRGEIVDKWRRNLTIGDTLDVKDRKDNWLEAIVIDIEDGTGDLTVHFKGYSEQFDEVIRRGEFAKRLEPLNTKSKFKSWRERLTSGSNIDVNIARHSEVDKPYWVKGQVEELELDSGRVKVRVLNSEYETDDYRKSRSSADPVPALAVYSTEAVALEDGPDAFPVATATLADDVSLEPTSVYSYRWYQLHSDDVAPAGLHSSSLAATMAAAATRAARTTYYGSSSSSSSGATSTALVAYPSSTGKTARDETDDDYYYGDRNVAGKPPAKGVVGLQNLGNTCFMNSILQCLSNTEPLMRYFDSGSFKDEINKDNVLGHGGLLATAYAKLVKDMWCDAYTKVVPRSFKKTIGDFQPQFAGYQQQDSQEFMGFLLDGLHEDLNRCRKKPVVTNIESKGRPDSLISRESWRRFLLRNDSALVDCMYGQLRSHVTCVNCGKESVTFDPFNTLSLPVPVKTARPIEVVYRPLPAGTVPLRITLEVEPTDQILQVKKKLLMYLKEAGYLSATTTNSLQPLKQADGGEAAISPTDSSSSLSTDVAISTEESDDGFVTVHTAKSARQGPYSEAAYRARCDAMQQGKKVPTVIQAAVRFQARADSKSKITRNVTDKMPIGDLTNGREVLIFYELEHPCPDRLLLSHITTYHSTPSGDDDFVSSVDLYVGEIKDPLYNFVDTVGQPARFNVYATTTGHDLYDLAFRHCHRYVRPGSVYYNNPALRPFVLHFTNVHATVLKSAIPDDNEVVKIPSDLMVVAIWRKEAMEDEHLMKDEVERVEDLQLPLEAEAAVEEVTDRTSAATISSDRASLRDSTSDKRRKTNQLSIYKCLDKFVEREQLNAEETLYCSSCKQHNAPKKKMDLWAAPDLLVVQLKRFQYIPGQYFVHREKINEVVDFPLEGLDLSAYVKGPHDPAAPPIYSLYAVSLHSGGLGGGHYTAVAKNPLNNQWYNFNDAYVSEASPESVVSSEAYVLFYRRQTGALRWSGVRPLEEGLPDDE